MTKDFLIIILLSIFSRPICSQNEQIINGISGLKTITIDTLNEKILVIHKRNVVVFFRQTDIQEYINDSKFGLPRSESFLITNAILKSNKRRIDLNDQKIDYTDEEIMANNTRKEPGVDQIAMLAMPEMSYIGAHLIMSGKFMVFENQTGKFISERINILTLDSEYGSRSVQFKLPSGLSFWRNIIFLGD